MNKQTIIQLIKQALKNKIQTQEDLEKLKRAYAKKIGMSGSFGNAEILKVYRDLVNRNQLKENKVLTSLLQTQKIRTLSGIATVACFTKPWPCPGQCVYCPDQKDMPKSYLNDEPAVMRAILCKFDPYKQVQARLTMLETTGHSTDKIELIVMGGCFTSLPRSYQIDFITRCFEACNNFSKKSKRPNHPKPTKNQKSKIQIKNKKILLERAQKINEKAKHRIIGITLETRPDHITPKVIKWFRELGATRVELGVQSLWDDVLKLNRRGHSVNAVIRATKLLKDAGFKINYHMMPNLPGSTPKGDYEMFKELFRNPDFQPDMLKIYPCVLTKESKLYSWWKQGKYKPYTDKQLINLLIKIKQIIPPYVRIMRLYRDIPVPDIIAGSKISNIREVVHREMEKQGIKCNCIRCREIKNLELRTKNLELVRKEYKASCGKEIFLSFEDKKQDKILAFLRLRISPLRNSRLQSSQAKACYSSREYLSPLFPILQNSAIVRELHVYGELVPISQRKAKAVQHFGLGKKLMAEAEKIAKEFGLNKIAVISGVGVREYYRKLGYKLKDTYMVKQI